ncbi:hypothetical protein [Rhizobacter sp. Root16D2]|uniref:hypothetical protein n=1 Tax=Rhizobacter sp. Root16D2 TaxID=1736479 RepID=UPI000B0C58FF|nr:hypothetical protein [Rhizobacter sp. Root16D2]
MPDLYQARGPADTSGGVVDRNHVAALITVLRGRRGADLEPVTILVVEDEHILIDGHHRYEAYRREKRRDIPVRYYGGSPTDALLEAGRENSKARLPMSKGQCSERAWTLVLSGCAWSAEQVAVGAGVSGRLVFKMRKRHKSYLAAGEAPPSTWREVCRGDFNADPDALDKMAAKWAENIGKAVGTPSTFTSTGKVEILGKAMIEWGGESIAKILAKSLVDALGLWDELEAAHEMDEEDEADLEF